MTRQSSRGISLIEVLLSITFLSVCLLSFIASTGKLKKGQIQNISKSKAMAATASTLEEIRNLAWDDYCVSNDPQVASTRGRGYYVPTPVPTTYDSTPDSATRIGQDGTEATNNVFDDVDDYSGQLMTNGPFRTTMGVYYVNISTNGNAMTIAAGNGQGVAAGDRTNFKLIIASTTWANGSVTLKTVVANGH